MRGDGVADYKQMNAIAIIASGTRFGDANGTFAPVVYADSAVRGEWRSTLLALHCSASLFPNDLWRDMIPFGVAGDLI